MASAKLQKKLTREGLYAVTRHNFRLNKNYSNKDIDPTRSHLNKHYGPQSAEEYRQKFREMIKAADEKHPPKRLKKDRNTMLEVIVWSPREGMSAEDEAKWSEAAYKVVEEMFPGQLIGGTYHADEVHDYTIKKGEEYEEHISRGNTHITMIPWTDEYGLRMDKFYNRSLPNKINAALDAKCMEMFGIPYRDGSGVKSDKTVEELKLESKIARLEKKVDAKTDEVETLDIFIGEKQATIEQKQATIVSLDAQIATKRKMWENIAETILKPCFEAQERLLRLFKSLKPKEQAKEEEDVFDIMNESKEALDRGNPAEIREQTKAANDKADQLEADYLSVVDDDDFELY